MKNLIRTLPVLLALLWATPVLAAQYSEIIPELPLMPGMVEDLDQAVSMDTPEGRIVQTRSLIQQKDLTTARYFYTQTLPQMGWVETKVFSGTTPTLTFTRTNEQLSIGFDTVAGSETEIEMIFEITPRTAQKG